MVSNAWDDDASKAGHRLVGREASLGSGEMSRLSPYSRIPSVFPLLHNFSLARKNGLGWVPEGNPSALGYETSQVELGEPLEVAIESDEAE